MPEEIQQLEYLDSNEDVTLWLEKNSRRSPVIFPYWPAEFPDVAPVAYNASGDMIVALSRSAMLNARHPERLWFCIEVAELLRKTDAEASWFKRRV